MDSKSSHQPERNSAAGKSNSPFFSVVVPTFNRPNMLAQALNTVLKQTFRDFELLVVDDHSGCDVQAVVDTFDDKRIRYFKNQNQKGANGARNTGIEASKGRWIKFLDDDDTWFPGMLKSIRIKIENDKQAGLIYTDYERYDFKKDQVIPYNKPSKPEGWVFDDLTYINFVGGYSFVAIKKEIFRKSGMLDEQLPAEQDWDLFLRIARIAEFGYVDEILGYYRRDHSDNISKSEAKRVAGLMSLYHKNKDELAKRRDSWLRMNYRIAKAAFLSKKWGVFLRFYPKTLKGIGVSDHNIIKLTKILTILKVRNFRR